MYNNIYLPVQHLRRVPAKPGGLCWIIFFKWEDVITWPKVDPVNGVINDAIVLKEDAVLYRCEVSDYDKVFTESLKVSSSGPYVEINVQGMLVDESNNNNLNISTMQFHQFGVLVEEKNGIIKLVGDEDSGCDMVYDYTSGDIGVSRKYVLHFTWEHCQRAPIFLGGNITIDDDELPLPGMLEGAFSDGFSDGFLT